MIETCFPLLNFFHSRGKELESDREGEERS
jgi:hypothetical protein